MIREINLPSGSYLFIEVPDDFELKGWNMPFYKLDEKPEIISTTKDITEEQAEKCFEAGFTADSIFTEKALEKAKQSFLNSEIEIQ